jgi:enolase-phosphatase E1
MASSLTSPGIRSVLLDIEGTVTPIAFVHEVLFPYARSHLKNYLAAHLESAETLADLAALRDEHALDVQQELSPPALVDRPANAVIDSVVSYVHWLIDRDRKSVGLKSLQGKIWKQGYLDGTLRAPLFADVLSALKRWQGAGLRIAIFSSGSIFAQKLLFAHTDRGDLTELIDAYFDKSNGSKTAVESYRRIAAELGLVPEEILFISDVVAELDAARSAGLQTLLCIRPGNQSQAGAERHQIIHSFDQIPELRSRSGDLI